MFSKITCLKNLTSFLKEESGMTLPMLALTFMVVTGFVGTSVDIARKQLVQSRLAFALDAAGLAAGSTISTTNLDVELSKYLRANFPPNYMRTTTPAITYQVSADNMIIDITASTTMPTSFMGIFGYNNMTISAKTQITRTSSGLELVMVLDNTGSMAGTPLTSLKAAATSLVNILYGSKTTVENLWIGLVPFSQLVNVGSSRTGWLDQTHYNSLNWGPTTWSGCLDARDTNGKDVVDDPPSLVPYKAYYSPSTDQMGTALYDSNPWVATRDAQGNPLTYRTLTSSRGPNAYCTQAMLPMTSNKANILSSINSMVAVGATHVNVGAIWGWNMLSPRWRGAWGGEMNTNNLPLDYGTKHMNKAVIILTDGANTAYTNVYTAYGFLSEGRLGTTTNTSVASATLNTKLSTVCTAMKNNGIYVYTIAFNNPGTTISNLLKGCATAPNYYFNSPTTSQLTQVFNAIADSLSNLRVSM